MQPQVQRRFELRSALEVWQWSWLKRSSKLDWRTDRRDLTAVSAESNLGSSNLFAPKKLGDRSHYLCLLAFRQVIIERQSEQPGADVLCDGTLSRPKFHSHRRQVQRDVMEHAQYALRFQVCNQGLAAFRRGKKQIEHVIGLLAFRRNHRQSHIVFLSHTLQMPPVVFPDSAPLARNFSTCPQRGQNDSG